MRFTNICDSCKHLTSVIQPGREEEEDPPQVCAAFPAGIPEEIWFGDFDHRKQFGTEAIQWQLLESSDPIDMLLARQAFERFLASRAIGG